VKGLLLGTSALLSACASTPQKYDSTNMASFTEQYLRPMASPLANSGKPLTLDDVRARTLAHNTEYARQTEQMMEKLKFVGNRGAELLPQVYAGAYSVNRNNTNASIGIKVNDENGSMPEDFYTAQDKVFSTTEFKMTWDLLDLGLSGLRNSQKTIGAYSQAEQNRLICNRLVVDVEHAYWRAVAAEQAETKYEWLKNRIAYALDLSQRRIEENPELKTSELMFQRELIDINRWYQSIFRSLLPAKSELAKLMNLPAGTEYTLSDQSLPVELGELVSSDLPALVTLAYQNRPEIRQALYARDAQQLKNKEDILRHLPALKLFMGASRDSNSFLLNNNFTSAGMNLSWDLMRLTQIGKTKSNGGKKLQDRQYETELMATAVFAQVVLAQDQIKKLDYDLSLAWKAQSVQAKITTEMDAEVRKNKQPETYLVKEELMRELSVLREQQARAEFKAASARLHQSIGQVSTCNPSPLTSATLSQETRADTET